MTLNTYLLRRSWQRIDPRQFYGWKPSLPRDDSWGGAIIGGVLMLVFIGGAIFFAGEVSFP